MTSAAAREANLNGPVPAFDHQLKTLSDSYLTFLTERIRIEESYIESLARLHRSTRALDEVLDDREPSTVRKVWRELRDNIDREVDARRAFCHSLKGGVLPPLYALRETQERTRKRIKEDLRESTQAHQDYLENVLPRLKRTYLKKCQEVEEYKSLDRPSNMNLGSPTAPAFASSSSGAGMPAPIARRASFGERPERPSLHQVASSIASITSPPPYLDRNKPLSDLAQQGKKGLNQLMGFLDQRGDKSDRLVGGGSLKEGQEKASNGLRGVRAKREADEADKEYRKGVHWLETLRLRRVKILQAGYHSLEEFVREAGDVLQAVLSVYVTAVSSTAKTTQRAADYGEEVITQINTAADLDRVRNFVTYAFARAAPQPVFYFNYQVGECRDLVFGVSLVDYAFARNRPNDPPSVVVKAITEIEARGMHAEGIYRVSGRHAALQDLTHMIEKNEQAFEFDPMTNDVYAVSSLLKLYLRELPEPLFKLPLSERLQHTEHKDDHIRKGFPLLKSKIRRLPPVHQVTLKTLLEHLARVASNQATNKMDVRNLAIVFGAVIFGEDELPKNGDVLSIAAFKDTVMEDLILYASDILGDLHGQRGLAPSVKSVTPPAENRPLQEPPLPSPPAESPSGVDYGSAFTKVMTFPPRSTATSAAGHDEEDEEEEEDIPPTKEEDFHPIVPTRPTPSIHPSRRVGTNTSTARSDTSMSMLSPRSPNTPSFSDTHDEFHDAEEDTPEDRTDSPMNDYVAAYSTLQSANSTPSVEVPQPVIASPTKLPRLLPTTPPVGSVLPSSEPSASNTSTVVPSSDKP